MAIGNLFGSGGESNSLYGTSLSTTPSSFIYFEWFIFKVSTGQPATPTGGSWDFLTNTGIPPTGWVSSINGVPLDNLWFSIAFVDSRNPTNITWSTTGLISAATSAYASAYVDKFTGNGSTTSWTLTADPVTLNNLDVSLNGVTQTPNTDYTISGKTFITSTAAPLGSILLVKYRQSLPNIIPGTSSLIGILKTANFNITTDQAIPITLIGGYTNYRINEILMINASIPLTTAAGGIYPAINKGGTPYVAASQTYTTINSGVNAFLSLTLTNIGLLSTHNNSFLYLNLTTPQGSTATADIYVFGTPLN
jgi:hypothetical protein